jgi:hypothetical protein
VYFQLQSELVFIVSISTTPKPAYWDFLSTEGSLDSYAHLLHTWTFAIFQSLEKNDSGYTFNLHTADLEHLAALKTVLQKDEPSASAIHTFHTFIKAILYPRADASTWNTAHKWKHPVECLLALSALRPDGNFKEATELTQMFARLVYHIRGAILYEATMKAKDSDKDYYQYVVYLSLSVLGTYSTPGLSRRKPCRICGQGQ